MGVNIYAYKNLEKMYLFKRTEDETYKAFLGGTKIASRNGAIILS